MKLRLLSLCLVVVTFLLNACSSATAKKEDLTFTAADSAAVVAVGAQVATPVPEVPRLPENIDAAHESFLRAVDSELRGDKALAGVFWLQAAELDPYNRYLGFKVAELLFADGKDSLALRKALWSNAQKGKVTASQLGLLARLFVREGLVDSCRKYFNAALDSSRYQDTGLLYDYSLFLEAIKDKEELVRVYDLLLPHVNYMPSLLKRQMTLLVDLNRDSAMVDLCGKVYDATGDRKYLAMSVEMMLFLKRIPEARAIVDAVTDSTEYDENMVVSMAQYLANNKPDSVFAFLKKKYYEDGVRTPLVANFLGHYEHINGLIDSAKVHLEMGLTQKGEKSTYVLGALQSLAGIALSEKRLDDAVRYAEAADSVANGAEKNYLIAVYGSAKRYEQAYRLLDSLIAVWDNFKPMEGIADSASLQKMSREVTKNKLDTRMTYGRVLCSEAARLERPEEKGVPDSTKATALRERAHEFFSYVLKANPADIDVITNMAMNLERLKKYDESFALIDNILASGKLKGLGLAELLNYYGYSLIELNRNKDEVIRGLEMVEKALEMDSANEAIMDSKAWGLYRLGKFADALKIMMQLNNKSFEKDSVYWEHLAAIQEALKMMPEAAESYKKLLELRPTHPEAKRFLKKKK